VYNFFSQLLFNIFFLSYWLPYSVNIHAPFAYFSPYISIILFSIYPNIPHTQSF
jgi:hypothetical protein